MNLNLTRNEVCDIMLALTAAHQMSDAEKWKTLHDKIKELLKEYDEKQETKNHLKEMGI